MVLKHKGGIMRTEWTTNDIFKLFKLKNRQILTTAEKAGRIPTALRRKKAGREVRHWTTDQVPEIGKQFGPFKQTPPSKPYKICIYWKKGGVLKTTTAYNLARTLALNGLKVLIVGLDSQLSITNLVLNPLSTYDSIEEITEYPGLYEYLVSQSGKVLLEDLIVPTDLPTLKMIPENYNLSYLPMHLSEKNVPHKEFSANLIPNINDLDFDIVVYDIGPLWNSVTANALFSSNVLVAPTGCEPASYQALDLCLDELEKFLEETGKTLEHIFLVPTMVERTNKLSTSIHAHYLKDYSDLCTVSSIRRSIKGAEAFYQGSTVREKDPSSPVAEDFQQLFTEIWTKIAGS